MKWLVEYDPEIHGTLQVELDENYDKMNKYINGEIKPRFNRNTMFLGGMFVRITEAIKKRVNEEITKGCLFRHKNIKVGVQEIEFKSYIDILPGIAGKPFKKMLTKKIEKPLRKLFKEKVISIKEVKENE